MKKLLSILLALVLATGLFAACSGSGLSLIHISYSGLTLSRKVLAPGKAIEVLFTVENTGAMAGVETAQVYVAHRNSAAHQPVRCLLYTSSPATKPRGRYFRTFARHDCKSAGFSL